MKRDNEDYETYSFDGLHVIDLLRVKLAMWADDV